MFYFSYYYYLYKIIYNNYAGKPVQAGDSSQEK